MQFNSSLTKIFCLLVFSLNNIYGQINDAKTNDSSRRLKDQQEQLLADGNITYKLIFNDGTIVPFGQLIYDTERESVRNQDLKNREDSKKLSYLSVKLSMPWRLKNCEGTFSTLLFDNKQEAVNAAYNKYKTGKCSGK